MEIDMQNIKKAVRIHPFSLPEISDKHYSYTEFINFKSLSVHNKS